MTWYSRLSCLPKYKQWQMQLCKEGAQWLTPLQLGACVPAIQECRFSGWIGNNLKIVDFTLAATGKNIPCVLIVFVYLFARKNRHPPAARRQDRKQVNRENTQK